MEASVDRAPGPDGRPIFFCVPGIGGQVMSLAALGQRLAPVCRMVAVRGGTAGDDPAEDTVERAAARGVETVLRQQPAGPFLLGGHSGGAAIAFEMAQQLARRGHGVGLLVLIDLRRPGWQAPPGRWLHVLRCAVGNLPDWVRYDLAPSGLRQMGRNLVRHLRHLLTGGPAIERILDLSRYPADQQVAMNRVFEMLEAYRPLPWPGRITLLRARAQPVLLQHDEPTLGWASVARGGVDLVRLPGNHLTIMREPLVAHVAEALRRRLPGGAA